MKTIRENIDSLIKSSNNTTRQCDLFQQNLTDNHMLVLHEKLHGKVEKLALNHNEITSEGLKTISQLLAEQHVEGCDDTCYIHFNITSLSLNGNKIDNIIEIGEALKGNENLERLFLLKIVLLM